MSVEIVVALGGDARSIYDETFDFGCLGDLQIRRASHVEPDEDGKWWADLSPVGGPKLGPFARRSEALDTEVAWLRLNWSKAISVVLRPCPDPIRKGGPMVRGVLALVVIVVMYLVLCGIVSCDRGCSARAGPIRVRAKTSEEVKRERTAARGAGGRDDDRMGSVGSMARKSAK